MPGGNYIHKTVKKQIYACNPSTQKADAGKLRVEDKPGLYKEITKETKANKNVQKKKAGLKNMKPWINLALHEVP